MDNTTALIVIAPLLAALSAGLFAWIKENLSHPIALVGLAVSFVSAFKVLLQVIASGPIRYRMAGWAPPMGIEYSIDLFNAMVLLLVSGIALLNPVASFKNVERETSDRTGSFYTIYLLFVTGLLGVTATGDLFNLYVLIEIT